MSSPVRSRWARVADKLGREFPRESLEAGGVRWADASERRPWIIAVSGGADSVVLALLIWCHWPQRRDRMVFAHFNHRLRGRASAGDERFCRALAKSLGVGFESACWADAPKDPSEAEAREVRHAFLERVRKQHRSQLVWTGHQRDDVAETMLMRLGRGSGTNGLAAPRAVQPIGEGRGRRLRPLLNLRAKEIRASLKRAGGRWREDASNSSDRYLRNRLRAEIVPQWEELMGRDAVAGVALSRSLLEEDADALEQWLRELDPFDSLGRLSLKALKGKPPALWRRAIHRWLGMQKDVGDLSRRGFEQLLALALRGHTCRFSLGKSGFVRIRRGWLFFEQPSAK